MLVSSDFEKIDLDRISAKFENFERLLNILHSNTIRLRIIGMQKDYFKYSEDKIFFEVVNTGVDIHPYNYYWSLKSDYDFTPQIGYWLL